MWLAIVLSASYEKQSSDVHCGWRAGEVWPGLWQHKCIQSETRGAQESQGKIIIRFIKLWGIWK